jgi:hypothetical protein
MAMIHGKQWFFLVFLVAKFVTWRNSFFQKMKKKGRIFGDFSTLFEIKKTKFPNTLDFGIS